MAIKMKQHTIESSISCSGVALHNGLQSEITLHPADENYGIKFRRIEQKENNIIDANFLNVISTNLGTNISNEYVNVNVIEHLMAALYACGIDNCLIDINNSEMPIMDGSSEYFIFMIESAGIKEQNAHRTYKTITNAVKVTDGKSYIEITPDEKFSVDITIEFDNKVIGIQQFIFYESKNSFKHEISSARTFCLEKEINFLRANGLAKGGSLNNAVVVSENNVLNEGGLRFNDEFVRHKLLDLLGDFFLAGHIKGKVKAYCPGHTINNKILREVFSSINVSNRTAS
jgi:UDP-3-O-[3-hydroxymyristoyl] N-acetylglucosamine deacetylase